MQNLQKLAHEISKNVWFNREVRVNEKRSINMEICIREDEAMAVIKYLKDYKLLG